MEENDFLPPHVELHLEEAFKDMIIKMIVVFQEMK